MKNLKLIMIGLLAVAVVPKVKKTTVKPSVAQTSATISGVWSPAEITEYIRNKDGKVIGVVVRQK